MDGFSSLLTKLLSLSLSPQDLFLSVFLSTRNSFILIVLGDQTVACCRSIISGQIWREIWDWIVEIPFRLNYTTLNKSIFPFVLMGYIKTLTYYKQKSLKQQEINWNGWLHHEAAVQVNPQLHHMYGLTLFQNAVSGEHQRKSLTSIHLVAFGRKT